MDMLQLQEQFINEVVEGIERPWTSLHVHYEHYRWSGGTSEKYTASLKDGEDEDDLDLTLEAIDCLLEMQKQIPAGQAEPWTWLEFSLDETGRYSFDFKYGVPPMTEASLRRQNG